MKMNDQRARALPHPETGQKDYADDAIPGLAVWVGKTTKSFRLVIGSGANRKRFTLGQFDPPRFTLAMAREKARDIIAQERLQKTELPRTAFEEAVELYERAHLSRRCRSGPSNIRRWIIENDWLDAIVALPDQLFYNTGIFTYVWLVTNRKPPERRGKVQLIDGTRFFQRMKKSLNNKRNEITEAQIRHLTRLYGNFTATARRRRCGSTANSETRVVSRIFENREFGFLKVTVERPLRMNFEATPERIARLDEQIAFRQSRHLEEAQG